MVFRNKALSTLIAGMCIAGFATSAQATTMGLSYEDTATGSINNPSTVTAFTVPGSAFYGNTFSAPTTPIAGSPSPGYGFYDDFDFSIPVGASADSITSTIDLGNLLTISNLEVRLYSLSGNAPPVLGAPSGGAIDAWTKPDQLQWSDRNRPSPDTTLAAGNYVLEVRGNATGIRGRRVFRVRSRSAPFQYRPHCPCCCPALACWEGWFAGSSLAKPILPRSTRGSRQRPQTPVCLGKPLPPGVTHISSAGRADRFSANQRAPGNRGHCRSPDPH